MRVLIHCGRICGPQEYWRAGRNYQLVRQESREGLKESNFAMCRKTCSDRKLRGYVRVHREIVRCNVVDRDDALKISLVIMEI